MSESRSYTVTGMTCSHCVKHVTDALRELPEVAEVMVTLRSEAPSDVVVTLNGELSDEKLRETIEAAGYVLAAVERE